VCVCVCRRVAISIDELFTGLAPVKSSDRVLGRLSFAFVLDRVHAGPTCFMRGRKVFIDQSGMVKLPTRCMAQRLEMSSPCFPLLVLRRPQSHIIFQTHNKIITSCTTLHITM
jgi:hypothetical protein